MGMLARARPSCPPRQELTGRRPTGVHDTVTGGATIAAISGSAQAPRCTAIAVVAQSASAIVASHGFITHPTTPDGRATRNQRLDSVKYGTHLTRALELVEAGRSGDQKDAVPELAGRLT